MVPFTKELLLEDFAHGLRLLSFELNRLVGPDRADALIAPYESSDLTPIRESFVRELPAGELLCDAYDFAYEGRLRPGNFKEEAHEIDAMVQFFAGLQRTVSFEDLSAFERCSRTMSMARRRMFLLGSVNLTTRGPLWNHISLLDLAHLAGVDDKTLRNMTSEKHPQRLLTTKIDGRTYVSLNVARPWLQARGFKPTVYEDVTPIRDFKIDPFLSWADFTEYVTAGRKRLGLTGEEFTHQLGLGKDIDRWSAVAEGGVQIDESLAKRLAKVLEVKQQIPFVTAALEIHEQWYDLVPRTDSEAVAAQPVRAIRVKAPKIDPRGAPRTRRSKS